MPRTTPSGTSRQQSRSHILCRLTASIARIRPAARCETKRRGELAELIFQLTAVQRGLKVSKPHGDSDRYDFIVDTGTRLSRVQVKATGSIQSGGYRVNSGRRAYKHAIAYEESEIDFLAAYIVPEETWYIIPVADLEQRLSLLIYPKESGKSGLYDKYREAWELLE